MLPDLLQPDAQIMAFPSELQTFPVSEVNQFKCPSRCIVKNNRRRCQNAICCQSIDQKGIYGLKIGCEPCLSRAMYGNVAVSQHAGKRRYPPPRAPDCGLPATFSETTKAIGCYYLSS